jgi:GTP pyrophosphokinase
MGAYVGQRLVPINYELNSTDKVTVLTSPSIRPNTSWMQYVRSDYAKTYLDKYFRHDSRSDNSDIETGKKMFNNILCDNRVIAGPILLGKILSHYKLPNNEELYKRIARYDISQDDLLQCISKIKQNSRAALKNDSGNRIVKKEDKLKYASVIINYKKPIQIDNSISFVAPSCCQPIPGDEALAFVDKDNILFVHRRVCIHAKELTATNGKKTTKVVWAENMDPMLAALRIEGLDRNGIILDVAKLLDKWNINIKLLKISENDGLFTGDIHVMIKNLRELERLSDQISEIQNVVSCKRINPNGEYFNIISDKQR